MRFWYVYYCTMFHAPKLSLDAPEVMDVLLRSAVEQLNHSKEAGMPRVVSSDFKQFVARMVHGPLRSQWDFFLAMKREPWFPGFSNGTVWRIRTDSGKHGLTGRSGLGRSGANQYVKLVNGALVPRNTKPK